MNALIFLLIAVGLSVFGSLIMWGWSNRPSRFDDSIEQFDKNRQALAPEGEPQEADSDYFGF
jgi:hypothetical protein